MKTILVALCALALASAVRADDDPVILRFAVMGGCRMNTKDWLQQGSSNPSSANVPQLRQTLADLAALPDVPSPFFLTGDIVDNLADDDGRTLRAQLDAWRALVTASPLWGRTDLIAMPGNHEMLLMPGAKPEVPNPATARIWEAFTRERGINAPAGNGPLADSATGRADLLAADQSRTTFSFTRAGLHFLCVNTDTPTVARDPATGKPFAGWIPLHWIQADLAAAQADPAVRAIFLLGHKPLGDPEASEEQSPIVNSAPYKLSDGLRAALLATPKVRAYLTGHEHLWQAERLAGPTSPWQIIIGNGGSKLSKHWFREGHHYFGFTVVTVRASGAVTVASYRRDCPERDDYANPLTSPAQVGEELTL